MRTNINTLITAASLIFFSASTVAQDVRALTPQQFNTLADKGGYVLLDVRTPEEWKAGHMKDAVHIDWYADDFSKQVATLDETKPILVYCASGGRSGEAQEAMQDLGFKKVVNLKGGMGAWKEAGLPVVK
ncbi:MAG: rhodanese-like domain-containing protein [Flavobacteriales bacterium]